MNAVTLITDGSADNRTGSGGWCSIIRTGSTLIELIGCADQTTSNRMELTAAIEGLKAIPIPASVTVITDSTYLLKTMKMKWYERWIEEERLGNRAKPRPNMDLWHQLIGLSNYHDLTFIKIKGHSGDYWNERADKLAHYARTAKVANRHTVHDWNPAVRCDDKSESGRQCKLHFGHSGHHHWTINLSKGIYDGAIG